MRGRRTLSFLARCELCVTQTEPGFRDGLCSCIHTVCVPFGSAARQINLGLRRSPRGTNVRYTHPVKRGALHDSILPQSPLFVNSLSSLYIPIKIAGIVHIAENAFCIKENPSPSSHPPQVTQLSHIRGNSSQDLNNFHIFHILFTFFARQKQIDPEVRVRPIQLCAFLGGRAL